jgi:hypothetical protein
MFHWLIVGHFDPLDPWDRTALPYKPKVSRPIPKDVAERLLDEFGRDIDPYLNYEEAGYVMCGWGQAPRLFSERVQEFAQFLAERQGAVVMSEMFVIYWPPEARDAQQLAWNDPAYIALHWRPTA